MISRDLAPWAREGPQSAPFPPGGPRVSPWLLGTHTSYGARALWLTSKYGVGVGWGASKAQLREAGHERRDDEQHDEVDRVGARGGARP